LKLLRDTIASGIRSSRRIRTLKSALAKLDQQERVVEPLPPPRAWVNRSIGQRKQRPTRPRFI
jgi:hypothetical protein